MNVNTAKDAFVMRFAKHCGPATGIGKRPNLKYLHYLINSRRITALFQRHCDSSLKLNYEYYSL